MKKCYLFDLDGTITREELLPIVARSVGLQDEIKTLTKLTIDGHLSFRESFRLRFALLKAAPVDMVRNAVSEVELDENILNFIQSKPDECFVITGNLQTWIEPIIERLGCKVFSSSGLVDGLELKSLSYVMHKADKVHELRSKFDRIIAVGDGANDLPMFEASDIGIAYGGVHFPAACLLQNSNYIVNDGKALCRLLNTL